MQSKEAKICDKSIIFQLLHSLERFFGSRIRSFNTTFLFFSSQLIMSEREMVFQIVVDLEIILRKKKLQPHCMCAPWLGVMEQFMGPIFLMTLW